MPTASNDAPPRSRSEATGASANGSSAGAAAEGESSSANSKFRKNTLDEMTVGRTEKPLAPEGWQKPRQSYGEEMRNDRGTNSAYGTPLGDDGSSQSIGGGSGETSVASDGGAKNASASTDASMDMRAEKKKRTPSVLGSLDRDASQKRRGKPKKTGRPGR